MVEEQMTGCNFVRLSVDSRHLLFKFVEFVRAYGNDLCVLRVNIFTHIAHGHDIWYMIYVLECSILRGRIHTRHNSIEMRKTSTSMQTQRQIFKRLWLLSHSNVNLIRITFLPIFIRFFCQYFDPRHPVNVWATKIIGVHNMALYTLCQMTNQSIVVSSIDWLCQRQNY